MTQAAAAQQTTQPDDNPRVLFVDDEAGSRHAFARSLSNSRYRVDLAASGDEAIAFANEHQYAVIATDYIMHGETGDEVIARLRAVQPNASYLLVTAHLGRHNPGRTHAQGGVLLVIDKPWGIEELRRCLDFATEAYAGRLADTEESNDTRPQLVAEDPDSETPAHRALSYLTLLTQLEERYANFTGCVEIARRVDGAKVGGLMMAQGNICLTSGTATHTPLGKMLMQGEAFSAEVLQQAVERARESKQPIGRVLVAMGATSEEELQRTVRKQVVLALQDVARFAPGLDYKPIELAGASGGSTAFSLTELYFAGMKSFTHGRRDLPTALYLDFADKAENALLAERLEDELVPLDARGWPCESIDTLRQVSRDVIQVAAPPALLAAQVKPIVLAAGTPKYGGLVVVSNERAAFVGGVTAYDRAKILLYVNQWLRPSS